MRFRLAGLLVLLPLAVGCAASASPSRASMEAALVEIQPNHEDGARELPLRGVRNGRDLGGHAGLYATIPPNHFFRTASMHAATEDDKKILLEHGVKLDVDLRTFVEAVKSPDALAGDPRFHYERISLFGVGLLDWASNDSRGDMYADALADHQGQFRKVFHALASQPEGAVLFHCAAGKDRTGLIAALLLSLAGVDRAEIVHDYAVSAHYLHPEAVGREALYNAIEGSPPSAIEEFLDALDNQYGGARSYLRTIGVSEEDIRTLSERLGQ
ncbi:MAG: tyrosine-protein phosphatase [Polyangiaceae bacterium]